MRLAEHRWTPRFPHARRACAALRLLLLLLPLLTTTGCAPGSKEKLAAAYKELDNPTPNSAEIIDAADAYLKESPSGPAAADALYLHGRALEEKAQRDVSTSQRDSAEAYNYYSQALTLKPRPALEGLIHVGMGNVLYFQDRYSAAIIELTSGLEKLDRDFDKAWTLYRIGLCQQRMGHWADADRSFAAVQQQFPNTAPAQRAREHQGNSAFWVQVGTYASPATADATTNELKRMGSPAQRFQDTARNLQYVRVGPFTTYDAALAARQRLQARYRDAIVVP